MPGKKGPPWWGLADLGKRLFLIDGAGALVSAFMIGGVLASNPDAVGMSRGVLLVLAGLAAIFALYSFSCYRWAGKRWRSFLRVIAVVNIAYCILTLVLMVVDYRTLRLIGAMYFILEIAVVVVLANAELAASAKHGVP